MTADYTGTNRHIYYTIAYIARMAMAMPIPIPMHVAISRVKVKGHTSHSKKSAKMLHDV
jgi:hypothetical protein